MNDSATFEGPFAAGFDAGNASVKIFICDRKNRKVYKDYQLHKSRVAETFKSMLEKIPTEILAQVKYGAACGVFANLICGGNVAEAFGSTVGGASATGRTLGSTLENSSTPGRAFDSTLGAPENSTECLIKGVRQFFPQAASIAEIGSQTSQFIAGLKNGNIQFSSNKNCAAGTGSFFEDQMTRLGTKIENYSEIALKADRIPRLAGRCSVFAKTDIIHLQQDGEKIENILKGLAYAMVNNFRGTIIQSLPLEKPVFLAGGTSKNLALVGAFKDILKLSDDQVIYIEESCTIQAAGAALLAAEKGIEWNVENFAVLCRGSGESEAKTPSAEERFSSASECPIVGGLAGSTPVITKSSEKNSLPPLIDTYPKEDLHKRVSLVPGEKLFLGIDVGSTSTNFLLLNQKNQVVDFLYFKTLGDSSAAVQKGFDKLKEKYGDTLNIIHSGVTGSGRIMIGKKFNIPLVRDEITAQATGTLFLNPDCDTIFEIGGQDAKYIQCQNGITKDFTMNKVCSAGTGSFIEDQAERLGLTAAELGQMALKSKNPASLDGRCTVFMKTSIENKIACGESLENICAGICYSVVKNYIHKVVANKKIGKKICFQGGLAFNRGIVAAFKSMFGDNFKISPYFSVTGALGMALLAKEDFGKLKIKKDDSELSKMNRELFENIQKTTFGKYREDFSEEKKTVGIPRSLMIYKLFPFAYTYFSELGFNVVLSEKTCEETVQQSQTLVQEETCFPIKLMHAHIQELVEAGCDYIFMPSVYTMQHKLSNLKNNYGCVYMQTAARLIAQSLKVEEKGIRLLNPVLQMDMGAPHMAVEMLKIGLSLGRNPLQCKNALMKAGKALKMAQKIQEEDGKKFLEKVSGQEKVLVLITRTYGLIDDVLNMGLPDLLLERGCHVITLGNLEGHNVDIAKDYENLYWPFSQHILSGAKIIKNTPNLYALYLTNHGCGPDTMISHLFAEIMGEKPYLQIEVDEHYSKTGLITRIEAFLSNLEKNENKIYEDDTPASEKKGLTANFSHLKKEKEFFIPHYDFLSQALCDEFLERGFKAKILPETCEKSLAFGKDFCTSKEYVTFASLAGDVMTFAENVKDSSTDSQHQLLLFQTCGSESDGFYSQVIRSILDSQGKKNIQLIAPKVEDLILSESGEDKEGFEIFWKAICRADENLKNFCLAQNSQKTFDNHHDNHPGKKHMKPSGKKILLTGDLLILLNKACNSDIFAYLKKQNVDFEVISLKEYFVFLWNDRLRREKKLSPAVKSRIKKLNWECKNVKGLLKIADRRFKLFTGSNGRYRYAKKIQAPKNYSAILDLTASYENAATILNMVKNVEKAKIPELQLQFDGTFNKELFEKLDAFLLMK